MSVNKELPAGIRSHLMEIEEAVVLRLVWRRDSPIYSSLQALAEAGEWPIAAVKNGDSPVATEAAADPTTKVIELVKVALFSSAWVDAKSGPSDRGRVGLQQSVAERPAHYSKYLLYSLDRTIRLAD